MRRYRHWFYHRNTFGTLKLITTIVKFKKVMIYNLAFNYQALLFTLYLQFTKLTGLQNVAKHYYHIHNHIT